MAASKRIRQSEEGQSVIEFMIMLPVFIAVVVLMVKSNSAVQMSIVNQQYARSQALWLARNSPYYPAKNHAENMYQTGSNRMVLGVSNNHFDDETTDRITPEAQVQTVVRAGKDIGDDGGGSEPSRRGKVRVRTTVAMCTHQITIDAGGAKLSLNEVTDQTIEKFNFCGDGNR